MFSLLSQYVTGLCNDDVILPIFWVIKIMVLVFFTRPEGHVWSLEKDIHRNTLPS